MVNLKRIPILLLLFCSLLFLSRAKSVTNVNRNSSKESSIKINKFNFFIEKQSLILYWSTATEVNTFQFEVQRKNVDTKKWERRGEVLAYGTSSSPKHYNFLEEEPIIGTSFYRLKVIDINGNFEYSKQIIVEYDEQITEIDDEVNYKFSLSQNYPNPFNPSTEILFTVPSQSNVTLSIFNSIGELVKILASGLVEAGEHSVNWNASKFSSGIYYLRITAKEINSGKLFNEIKKMVLIK